MTMNIYKIENFKVRSFRDWDVVLSARVAAETAADAAELVSDRLMEGEIFPSEERLDLKARLIKEIMSNDVRGTADILDLNVVFRKEP